MFTLWILMAILCQFVQPKQIFLGPAVPPTPPQLTTQFKSPTNKTCPGQNQFIYTIETKIHEPLIESDFQPVCYYEPVVPMKNDSHKCNDYAIGYQVWFVPDVGISQIELECGRNHWVRVWERGQLCFQNVIMGKRFRCDPGWAICGWNVDRHFTKNIEFKCCQLEKRLAHLTLQNQQKINNKIYEILGQSILTDKKPNETTINCPDNQLAYGLEINSNTMFKLKCGQSKLEEAKTCPWYINGLRTNINNNRIVEIDIGCSSGDWINLFWNKTDTGDLIDIWRCSEGYGVCGMKIVSGVGKQGCDMCGSVETNYLYPRQIKFTCCKIPQESVPCQPYLYFTHPKTVGLTTSNQLITPESFNYKTNPLIQKIINLINVELVKQKYKEIDFNYKPTPAEQKGYQLIAKCGQYEIATNQYKKANLKCDELKKLNIVDCKCQKPIKSRCDIYWETYAVVSKTVLTKPITNVYTKDSNEWTVGAVKVPRSYLNINYNTAKFNGTIDEINSVLCQNGIESLNSGLKVRIEKRDFKLNQNLVEYHFQLMANCFGQFEFRFDVYKNITVGIDWMEVRINCKLPVEVEFGEEMFRELCLLKEIE